MNEIENLQMTMPSTHERELTITVPGSLVDAEFTDALNKKQRVTEHKGFRPGKMPKNMVLNFYGKKIKEELMAKLIEKSFIVACKEKGLTPVSQPKMEPVNNIEQDKPFIYRAIFQVKPHITTPLYKGLSVELKKVTITESDLNHEMTHLQENMATFITPEGRIDLGANDSAQCDIVIKINGVISKEHSYDYAIQLFDENISDELKNAFIGKKVSESFEVNPLLFDGFKNNPTEGIDYQVIVTIISFKERILPSLDDDFAKDISDKFESLEDLKKSIIANLINIAKRREEYYKQEAITHALIEKNPLEIPPALIERTAISLINSELAAMGAKVADSLVKNHWQEIWDSVQNRALFKAKAELLFESLIRELEIKANEEEIRIKVESFKNINKEEAEYFVQVEKLLKLIEKEAIITTVEEPFFRHED